MPPTLRPAEVATRTATWPDQFDFDGHDALTASMREAFGDVGVWVDSSMMTATETVDHVVTAITAGYDH